MRLNHNEAGYYIEIEHNINSKKYISRYLHLEAFEGSELYKKYQENKNKTYVKAGDIIGIISGTPYINNKLRYPKHLHYTLCLGSIFEKIDPICFNVNLSGIEIDNPELMFMNIPANLKPTCDGKCQSCKSYFETIAQKYKLDWENWGD